MSEGVTEGQARLESTRAAGGETEQNRRERPDGARVGGFVGLLGLMVVVHRFEGAHAGHPPLNAGVIGGYLLGALAAGVPLTTALGL